MLGLFNGQLWPARAEPDGEPQSAPVPAIDKDRCRKILHHGEVPTAHIPAIGLMEERGSAAPRLQTHTVVKNAPVAAVGSVPDSVFALRFRELAVMRRKVSVRVHCRAEDNVAAHLQGGFLNVGQDAIRELGKPGHHLLRIGIGYRHIRFVEERLLRDVASLDRGLKEGRGSGRSVLHVGHKLRLLGASARGCSLLNKRLRDIHEARCPLGRA